MPSANPCLHRKKCCKNSKYLFLLITWVLGEQVQPKVCLRWRGPSDPYEVLGHKKGFICYWKENLFGMASLATSISSQGQVVGIVGGGFPPSGGCTSSSPRVHERAPKFSACSPLSPSVVVVSLLEVNLHLNGLPKYIPMFLSFIKIFGVTYYHLA